MPAVPHHAGRFWNVRVDIIFCAMGFSAMVGQVLLLRRMMAVFGGNELVVGAVFVGWVFWAGLGNLVFAYIADRVRDVPRLLSLVLNLGALALPVTVLATALTKCALGIPAPRLVGLPVIAAVAMVVLAPLCFMVGAGLTLASKLPATGRARDIGVMYLFDALGAGVGGLIATWFAISAFTPFQIALMTALVVVFVNGAILVRKKVTQLLTALIALCLAGALLFAPAIEIWSTAHRWEGYRPIANLDSRYGNLVVTDQGEERTLFVDGVPLFSTPLAESYEPAAILPLLMHPDPKRVLLIGGGLSGMMANWRDTAVERIVYLQVDDTITRLERTLMGGMEAMSDERVEIRHVDALTYLKAFDAAADGGFDVVVLNVGAPETASGSRLMTDEFFAEIKRALTSDGVVSFGVFEPGNAISPEAAGLLGTVRATLGVVFDAIVTLPFDHFYFVASRSDEFITDDTAMLIARIKERGYIAPQLVGHYLASVFPERIQSANAVIAEAASFAPRNTVVRPVAYFTGMLLWASRSGGAVLAALETASFVSWHWFAGFLILAAVLSIVMGLVARSSLMRLSSFWTLFAIGFGTIIYEIVLLVYYQMRFGVLFYRMGIIITAFMVGLSLGAYASIRLFGMVRIRTGYLIAGLLVFAGYQPLLFATSGASFTGANLVCGIIGGFLFEATAEWMVARREEIGHAAGWLGCANYWGSAVGALIASVIAVPLMGLPAALLMAAAVPLAAAAVLVTTHLAGD